jgi:hypothetical protein
MVRSQRIQPNMYFGRPGALTTIPWPRGDIDKPYDRQTFDFVTGTGQHMVSSAAAGSRAYSLAWNALHVDNFSLLEQYWNGSIGVGPWALIDPSATNLLLPNQASATNNFCDTTGWKTVGGAAADGTILSNSSTSFIHRTAATRSIRWQFTVGASTTPQLAPTAPYRNWFGIPVVPSLAYAWSLWARPDGVVDSSITMAAKIQWMDAAGATLSTSTGGDVVVAAAMTKLTVTAVTPAGAAYALPYLNATGSTITTTASIYADEFLFEQDSVFNTWAPGTGVRAVDILALTETSPFDARWRKGATMTVRELAV